MKLVIAQRGALDAPAIPGGTLRVTPAAPVSGVLTVPDNAGEVVVLTAATITSVQTQTMAGTGSAIPVGARLDFIFPSGGTLFGLVLAAGGCASIKEYLGSWLISAHS